MIDFNQSLCFPIPFLRKLIQNYRIYLIQSLLSLLQQLSIDVYISAIDFEVK